MLLLQHEYECTHLYLPQSWEMIENRFCKNLRILRGSIKVESNRGICIFYPCELNGSYNFIFLPGRLEVGNLILICTFYCFLISVIQTKQRF